MIEKPWQAEIIDVTGSPGELDNIRISVIVRDGTNQKVYENIKPINYIRKPHTCVGPVPGRDFADIIWRGEHPVFTAPFEAEMETCPGMLGGALRASGLPLRRIEIPTPRRAAASPGMIPGGGGTFGSGTGPGGTVGPPGGGIN